MVVEAIIVVVAGPFVTLEVSVVLAMVEVAGRFVVEEAIAEEVAVVEAVVEKVAVEQAIVEEVAVVEAILVNVA